MHGRPDASGGEVLKSFLFTRQAFWIILGCLFCQAGAGLFYASRAIAPDVIGELGWTRTMWSSAMAPMIFVTSVCQALVGAACVRYGIRPVLVGAVLCLGATFFVLAGMQSLPAFYAATMLLALGNAGIGDVSVGAVITRWFERSRGVALGFAFAGSNIGAVVFVQGIAEGTRLFGWRGATAAVGVAALLAILPFALFVVRDPRPGEGERAVPGGGSAPGVAGPIGDENDLDLPRALRSPAFWILFFTVFCYAVAQLGMMDHLILYLVDLGYEKGEAADAMGLTVGAGIVAKLGAGAIALRVPTRILLVANTLLLAAAIALLPFVGDPRILAVCGIAFGIATSARDVLIPLAAGEFFGARFFAGIYGVMMLAYFPGGALGPIALARAHDLFGTYEIGFALCFAILLAALVGQLVAVRPSFGRRELAGSAGAAGGEGAPR